MKIDKVLKTTNIVNIFKQKDCSQDFNFNRPTDGKNILTNYEFSTPLCSKIEDYSFGQQIGKGAYAEVRECTHKKSGERVAIK
mmetsp:Transcript_41777/g.63798  ORF Transcript_41777/g.63798 Transcript_41777/m.63798 type:complete len:83 (+) Transcript_41777:3061-3309(+)